MIRHFYARQIINRNSFYNGNISNDLWGYNFFFVLCFLLSSLFLVNLKKKQDLISHNSINIYYKLTSVGGRYRYLSVALLYLSIIYSKNLL